MQRPNARSSLRLIAHAQSGGAIPRSSAQRRSSKEKSSAENTCTPLHEPALFYDPPYDGALDDSFAWHLVKYLAPASGLQYKVQGLIAEVPPLQVDFLVEQDERRIGFMCGTSEAGWEQDRLRDALFVGSGAVDVLYRFRAIDLERHLHDVLFVASKWDPELFSDRGRTNLEILASPDALRCHPTRIDMVVRIQYGEAKSRRVALPSETLVVHRISRQHPAGWIPAYEAAQEEFGLSPGSRRKRWARSA